MRIIQIHFYFILIHCRKKQYTPHPHILIRRVIDVLNMQISNETIENKLNKNVVKSFKRKGAVHKKEDYLKNTWYE